MPAVIRQDPRVLMDEDLDTSRLMFLAGLQQRPRPGTVGVPLLGVREHRR
jgi:hypothetical protein